VSRLWSRFGIRTLAIGLLAVGVAGGAYLGEDRETQQTRIDAAAWTQADMAEQQMMKEHMHERSVALAEKRAAEQQAAAKAAAAAKVAAERAKRAEEEASRKRARAQERESAEEEPAKPPSFGPVPASCKEYSGNRAIGCALMLDAGFGLDQMTCLEKLWTKESGWNEKAANSSTGAYGIPQALPGSKMQSAGDDWKTNPATQIKWGLGYVKGRYDTPCGAWSHFQSEGWY
jgi:hypothetical protein